MSQQPTQAKQRAILERLERFSRFTDSSIGLPFTRFKIGVEAIIGLVPVLGDLVGLAMSGYVLLEAQRAGASADVKRRMLGNIGVDFLGGLLPVVGDAFDAIYKANTRNTRLLKNYIEKQLSVEPPPADIPWKTLVGLSAFFAAITGALVMIF